MNANQESNSTIVRRKKSSILYTVKVRAAKRCHVSRGLQGVNQYTEIDRLLKRKAPG